jgi:hypothetical protein
MWSSQYRYLNIYGDAELTIEADTKQLRDFLNTLPQLKQVTDFKFRNTEVIPFAEILLLKAGSLYRWNENDTDDDKVNLVAIVCSEGDGDELNRLRDVFLKIASFLNWDLVEEGEGD